MVDEKTEKTEKTAEAEGKAPSSHEKTFFRKTSSGRPSGITTNSTGKIDTSFFDGSTLGVWIHALTNKATPVDADEFAIADSAASWTLKRLALSGLSALYGKLTAANTWTNTNNFQGVVTITGAEEYMTVSGGTSLNWNASRHLISVSSVTSTQKVDVDFVLDSSAGTRTICLHAEIMFHRDASTTVYGWILADVVFRRPTAGSAAVMDSYDFAHNTSGTDACAIAAINDGVRLTLDSSAFGNTLNRNNVYWTVSGVASQLVAATVTIT